MPELSSVKVYLYHHLIKIICHCIILEKVVHDQQGYARMGASQRYLRLALVLLVAPRGSTSHATRVMGGASLRSAHIVPRVTVVTDCPADGSPDQRDNQRDY